MTDDLGPLVVEASLLALSARERIPVAEAARRLREGDARLHAEYRVALAWAVHHHLRRSHPHVEEVYVVGSSLEEAARRASDLDLVVFGARFGPEDEERLRALNASVSRAYAALVGGLPPGFQLLDLHLVPADREDHPYRRLVAGSGAPAHRLA